MTTGTPRPTLAHRLAHRVGRRGAALLFFAGLDLLYGYAFLIPSLYPAGAVAELTYRTVRDVMPYPAWGVVWMLVGVVCLVQAFTTWDAIAYGAAITLKIAWGSCFLVAWQAHGAPRAWISALIWLGFAAFVALISGWPEPMPRRLPAPPPLGGSGYQER